MSSLAIVPSPLPKTLHPAHFDPDRLARAHARREVKVLSYDLIIARARCMARRALPEVASLPCGCNAGTLCPEAAQLYWWLSHANSREWKGWAADFVEHRKALAPRAISSRVKLTSEGLWHAAQVLAGQA